jgi:hypothetical protein
MGWVKASERSPEPKPEMDGNKKYSFSCKHDGKEVTLYFWSFNWWGERYDGEIYGVSEEAFKKLEWLDKQQNT